MKKKRCFRFIKIALYCFLFCRRWAAVCWVRFFWKKGRSACSQATGKQAKGKAKHREPLSLSCCAQRYLQSEKRRCCANTYRAKRNDIGLLLQHSQQLFGDDVIVDWPQRMRRFEEQMLTHVRLQTAQRYRPATLNRLFSTVNHFSCWLHAQGVLDERWRKGFFRRLPVGAQRQPALDDEQWQVLQQAVDALPQERHCPRRRPGLQCAVLQVLQSTGLRASELVALNVQQLRQGALHAIRRKGDQMSARIFLPVSVFRTVVSYLTSCRRTRHVKALLPCGGRRMSLSTVTRICQDLSMRACRLLPAHRAFRLTPHMLRRTLLQRIYRSQGLQAAYRASGNRTLRGMLCYVYRERPNAL